jgi:hypothetical protein
MLLASAQLSRLPLLSLSAVLERPWQRTAPTIRPHTITANITTTIIITVGTMARITSS